MSDDFPSGLDLATNQELIDELFRRETFKGMLIARKGDVNNTQDGDGGALVRASKGMQILHVMECLHMAMNAMKKKYCKAFEEYFEGLWTDD